MKWSVSIQAEGDRVLEIDEIVALADAVAPMEGIASGIGTMAYGAQVVVEADSSDEAANLALSEFIAAAAVAKLPDWPVVRAEVIGYEDEFADGEYEGD
jgi:ribonuclease PH